MKDYAEWFYKSKTWQNCRASYLKSVGGLCERCLKNGLIVPADIVHHKVAITPDNINNPSITLDWSNLECVCQTCHNRIHLARQKRYKLDELGRVTVEA